LVKKIILGIVQNADSSKVWGTFELQSARCDGSGQTLITVKDLVKKVQVTSVMEE
jgi:hypothetical protein